MTSSETDDQTITEEQTAGPGGNLVLWELSSVDVENVHDKNIQSSLVLESHFAVELESLSGLSERKLMYNIQRNGCCPKVHCVYALNRVEL